jgi:very-short-patch-repair endonuclease
MLVRCPRSSAHRAEVLAARSAGMRSFATPSEALLWSELRGGRLGVRFVRQAVIGPFIVDFLAPALRLVVEVDGGYHARRRKADERRDAKLRRWGYRVVRVRAEGVVREVADVVRVVRGAL